MTGITRIRRLGFVAPWLLVAVAAGCGAPIQIDEIDEADWFRRESRSALDSDSPSERTTQFLRREALLTSWREDPDALMKALEVRLFERKEAVVALYLAELAFLQAKRHRDDVVREPAELLTCAEHAWAALFDPGLASPLSHFDPGFRLACDLYNRSLAWLLRYAAVHRPARDGTTTWKVLGGETVVAVEHSDYTWDPRDYEEMVIAYDLDVKGLALSARSYGIGVPAIVSRATVKTPQDDPHAAGLIQNIYGATILLHFDGSIAERAGGSARTAHVDIYDPLRTSSVEVAGRVVPLEADLSTTLAYTLTRADEYSGFRAMFNPDEYQATTRLLMLQPFDPDKIPVVFVHGLMSSPMTWMPLLNDLLADPAIRERFQFWFFRYSTGNPPLYSASLLRTALVENLRRFDPEGKNPRLHDMVLVGHSMGGLLARIQVRSSEDRLWKLITDEPFDKFVEEVELDDGEAQLYRRAIFFERLPFIRRVVFMSVPHRGAELAQNWFVRIATGLITLPKTLANSLTTTVEKGQRFFRSSEREDFVERLSTASGIGGLAPDNTVQESIAGWPYPVDLPIHSVIGNEKGTEPGGTDGIVPYTSSHLDGVASEVIIHSGHNVQTKPEAVIELRRILMLHLGEYDEAQAKAKAAASGE